MSRPNSRLNLNLAGFGTAATCIMHECASARVYRRLWVCRRQGWGCTFIPKALPVGGHSEENEMSDRAQRLLEDWQEGREGRICW